MVSTAIAVSRIIGSRQSPQGEHDWNAAEGEGA